MRLIRVGTQNPYEVYIGDDILDCATQYACISSRKCVIVSDDNVSPLYGNIARESFSSSGCEVFDFVIPHGEKSKNPDMLVRILEFFAECGLDRSDTAVALGGGVVGDITGLAASLYMRGIDYVQLPTSLLAMTDSSVGGKTAVDLSHGKNLMGAFYQPKAVICDVALLKTLPPEYFSDGMAEVIKYGMINSPALFNGLFDSFDAIEVVSSCVATKAGLVQRDELDRGVRAKLNFGHTAGHAIELLSGFSVSHGRAVAMGMALVTRAAESVGYCRIGVSDRLCELLKKYGLPTECPYSAAELAACARNDKKKSGDVVELIVPKDIGSVSSEPISFDSLADFYAEGIKNGC